MDIKRLLLAITLVLFFIGNAWSQAFKIIYEDTLTIDNVRYELIADIYRTDTTYYASVLPADDKWETSGSKHYEGDIVIVPNITYKNRNYPVVRTSANCFRGCIELENVYFPETLIGLGDFAFAECGELKITLPIHITRVGTNVFSGSILPMDYNLTNITYFDNGALEGCNLKRIVIGPWNNDVEYAFIGSYCFKNTNIETVIFMEQEQAISMPIHAFAYCNIKELKLPKRAKMAIELVYKSQEIERIIFPDTDRLQFIGDFQTVAPGMECCYADSWNLIAECPNLKEIVAMSINPPQFYWYGSKYDLSIIDDHSQCVLKVPQGSEELYRADPVWGRFERIEGFAPGEYTGINEAPVTDVESGAAPVYYNLQGMQVKEPVKGQLYICRTGAKTAKIVY